MELKVKLNARNQQKLERLLQEISSKGGDNIDVNAVINEAIDWAPTLFWEDKSKRLSLLFEGFHEAVQDPEQEKALRSLLK